MRKWSPEMQRRSHRALQIAIERKKKHDMLKWVLGCSPGVESLMLSRTTKTVSMQKWKATKSAGPSLEGHQGCGRRVQCLFLSIAVIAIQLAAYAFMSLEGPKTRGFAPTRSSILDLGFRQKSFRFQACFQGLKSEKN